MAKRSIWTLRVHMHRYIRKNMSTHSTATLNVPRMRSCLSVATFRDTLGWFGPYANFSSIVARGHHNCMSPKQNSRAALPALQDWR
jgi:hypothetical protein